MKLGSHRAGCRRSPSPRRHRGVDTATVGHRLQMEDIAPEHDEAASPRVEIIRDAATAPATLKSPRPVILAASREPASTSALAQRLGLPRQRLSHRIRKLENIGLVRLVERRRRRGCVEPEVQATARLYLLSPDLLGETDPQEPEDLLRLGRLGWLPLVAIAGQAIRALAILRDHLGEDVPALPLPTRLRFSSATAFAILSASFRGDSGSGRQVPRRDGVDGAPLVHSGAYPEIAFKRGKAQRPATNRTIEVDGKLELVYIWR